MDRVESDPVSFHTIGTQSVAAIYLTPVTVQAQTEVCKFDLLAVYSAAHLHFIYSATVVVVVIVFFVVAAVTVVSFLSPSSYHMSLNRRVGQVGFWFSPDTTPSPMITGLTEAYRQGCD